MSGKRVVVNQGKGREPMELELVGVTTREELFPQKRVAAIAKRVVASQDVDYKPLLKEAKAKVLQSIKALLGKPTRGGKLKKKDIALIGNHAQFIRALETDKKLAQDYFNSQEGTYSVMSRHDVRQQSTGNSKLDDLGEYGLWRATKGKVEEVKRVLGEHGLQI